MTLPDRILSQLAEIDSDRTRAVVKVTEAVVGIDKKHFLPVELVEMAPGKSLIVIGPSRALNKIPWLKLIEIAPARFLLTVPPGTSIEVLEVALRDLSHDQELQKNEHENAVLQEMLNLIGHQRRARRLSKAEILIIDTDKPSHLSLFEPEEGGPAGNRREGARRPRGKVAAIRLMAEETR